MALADIVRRIDSDAETEAAAIVTAAQDDADRFVESADREAVKARELSLERARTAAKEEASLRVAGARLRGRDRLLSEKRVLVDRVFTRAHAALVSLPDDEYAMLLAQDIASATRGGEDVMLGTEDADRLQAHLPGALESFGCDARVMEEPATLSRGALLVGDRMRVEVSIDSLIAARREEYETLVADYLFGGEGQ